jgi:hypothetical protein
VLKDRVDFVDVGRYSDQNSSSHTPAAPIAAAGT